MATIEERYAQKFAKSMEWCQRARASFAGGVASPTRIISPFPVCFEYGEGPFKYDVEGQQIVDYVMGNGALLMGHSPPEVVAAARAQAGRGTNLGAANVHEIRFAEEVIRMVPSVEQVRFTTSGTESTYLALRLARAYTGKTKILKFPDHYHGWHDYVTPASGQAFGGIPQSILDTVIVAPADISEADRILSEDDDIAALIAEPNGAHYGTFPLQNPQFLRELRKITARRGVVFIMDEVITGFRLSPGGAQMLWDVEPDLTTMAKNLAGGHPGGAVGGKTEIMDLVSFKGDPEWDGNLRVPHAGTFNAAPVSAAAGLAILGAIATGQVNAMADTAAERLKKGLNETFIRNEVTGHAHGISSIVHVNLGADCHCDRNLCTMPHEEIQRTMPPEKTRALQQAMLVNGIDTKSGRAFFTSSAHDDEVIDRTIEAFSQSLKDLREEALI